MKIIRAIILTIILIIIGCSKKSTEPVIPNPKLSFDPAAISLAVGHSSDITLRIDNLAEPIFAASMQIKYNGAKISIADSLLDNLNDIFGENAIRFVRIDSSLIRLSLTRIQGEQEITGSGIICGFTLTGVSAGACSLSVISTESDFFDSIGSIVNIDSLEYSPEIITVQ
jgi:hypothetical protein